MKRNIVAFHPSRGALGSAFQTQDGKFYVRTRWGSMNVRPEVGMSVAGFQYGLAVALRPRLYWNYIVLGLSILSLVIALI